MDKGTPHYKLSLIQTEVARLGLRAFTATAHYGGLSMGLSENGMLAVIANLGRNDFRKSMTTYANNRVWQDVYNAATPCADAYIKFTLRADGAIVISFKRL
jgi:motility quorum-sensing regulator/GCU-specific mRNA interferase toxin